MLELDAFKYHLMRGQRRQRTVDLHLMNLNRLYNVTQSLEVPAIEKYLMDLKASGRKATYINDFIDVLRIYGRFVNREDLLQLTYFKEEAFIKATLSDEEIEAFLALPPTRKGAKETANYAVWTLFFTIMAFSGMRPGEVAHLTVDAVDFGRQVFILETTKTTPRLVPIAPGLVKSLTDHIKSLSGNSLFPSRRNGKSRQGGVVNDVDWGYNFHSRLKRLGIKRKNLSPYSLRHSFITRMLDEDVSLPKVQKIVGHRRIDTTMHYTHLTTKDIVKALAKDPLSRKDLSKQELVTMGQKALESTGHIVVRAELLATGKVIYETVFK